MKSKLKIALVLLSFGATMLTVYAANHTNGGHPTVGVDVTKFSPQVLSISSRVAGEKKKPALVTIDSVAIQSDSLSGRNN